MTEGALALWFIVGCIVVSCITYTLSRDNVRDLDESLREDE